MRSRLTLLLIGGLALGTFAITRADGRTGRRVAEAVPVPAPQEPASGLSRKEFAGLIERISEPGGYFDTDNLISNESSYLHVIDRLDSLAVRGGAFIGVGPAQNFSYMARVRPEIAFIIDIRRDNALQHLWFKALFELAPTRIEYLALMLGRQLPAEPAQSTELPIDRLVERVRGLPRTRASLDGARRSVLEMIRDFGLDLSLQDLAVIGRIHERFADAGFELRFTTFGRPPRPFYPTFERLLLETDLAGRRANYLAAEEDYRFVRELQRRNLVLPVVGDLAGTRALPEIGRILRERNLTVSAFYVSNVEFYLMQDGRFARFARNAAALPATERTVLIRSVFGRFYAHPENVPGYYSTQLLQPLSGLVHGFESGVFQTYDDLVYAVEIRR